METILIAKQTAAKTETRNFIRGEFPKMVQVDGDLAANTIPIMLIGIDGNITTAYATGAAVTLSATKTVFQIDAPCCLAFVKGVTTNAVGLRLIEKG